MYLVARKSSRNTHMRKDIHSWGSGCCNSVGRRLPTETEWKTAEEGVEASMTRRLRTSTSHKHLIVMGCLH